MISPIWLKFYELMKRINSIESLNLKDVGYYNCSLLGADGYCMVFSVHTSIDGCKTSFRFTKWIQHASVCLTIIFHDRCGSSKHLHSHFCKCIMIHHQ